mmetsp:Transcript_14278/g.19088  ORF Transcript_14278/g.19088 Transcript_14278/m.19088 type:complete len:629 (-) Transcript_14278:155-2041(-)|eukprot:CAMPEP_0197288400 /NCGR_PEP_ID=MMETSP0890-20130614/5454_1 /TAXON_ID=44058 ORGANISM="Aureoumbra lagunensis, Strain CCMP1510" /NCGR_SAMPLE_ID=MMETSP0890 /ASSEMBLY_ACC=CAM_ASM_000533 /LENGTH=628 /DNA_ID=CAMNT_0042759087 /DNA_START=128 /DNA_END=2014 /DNA_ORIENTATION=+
MDPQQENHQPNSRHPVQLTATSPVFSTAMDAAVAAATAAANATTTILPSSLSMTQESFQSVTTPSINQPMIMNTSSHQEHDDIPPPPPSHPPPPLVVGDNQPQTNDVSALLAESVPQQQQQQQKKRNPKSNNTTHVNPITCGTNRDFGPIRPKRPRTAYHFFYDHRRQEELRKDPKRDNNELSKVLAEEWKTITDKTNYERLAEAAKVEYDRACREYEITTGHLMSDCIPKKPPTAYMLFFRAQHVPNVGKQVDNFSKVVGTLWKSMTNDERKIYHDQAADLKFKYERACAFLARKKQDMVGQSFIDLLSDGRTAIVQEYHPDKDQFVIVYPPDQTDSVSHQYHSTLPSPVPSVSEALQNVPKPPPPPFIQHPIIISMTELRARVCGDDKASKRANKLNSPSKKMTQNKRQAIPATSIPTADNIIQQTLPPPPPPPATLGAPMTQNTTKKRPRDSSNSDNYYAPWLQLTDEALINEEEMINVIRLCRRLIGGACIQNLRKMCATLGLPINGNKVILGNRLEMYLRFYDFKSHDFKPTATDVEQLTIDEFNAKYDKDDPLKIEDIASVLEDLMQKHGTVPPDSKRIKLDDPILTRMDEDDHDEQINKQHQLIQGLDDDNILPSVGDMSA